MSDSSTILDREFGSGRGTPIDRKLIEQFLISELKSEPNQGKVLEFSENTYTKQILPNSESYKFIYLSGKRPKIDESRQELIGDLMLAPTIESCVFELIISTQLLAFTTNPFLAAENLKVLLKPGGKIVGTEPFCSPLSNYDHVRWGDYFRFTRRGIESVFGAEPDVTIRTCALGNWKTSLALYKGLTIEDNLNFTDEPDESYATNIGYVLEKYKIK